MIGRASRAQFGDDRSSFNRLSKPHIVCQQEAAPETTDDRESRLQLMREQVDVCVGCRPQLARERLVQQAAQGVAPADCAAEPWSLRETDVINGVEGRKQLALDAVIAWCGSRNRDQLATVKRGRVDDAPAIAASSDEVSGVKNLH